MTDGNWLRLADVARIREAGCLSVHANGHTLALFAYGEQVYAVDNRCPHMGFPLDKGTVKDGILTCYWHYARFDLATGGTFDQWADDVRAFPVELRDGGVWVDVSPQLDIRRRQEDRLLVGLEQDLPLVIGKSVLALIGEGAEPAMPFRTGLAFGSRYRREGWGQGLTMLTCFMNMAPFLDVADRPRALYQGLAAVARDSFGSPPRFPVRPLPGDNKDPAQLKRWFRRFVEVRDDEGAERCIVSAVRAGADDRQMADMLFTAATDHRYIQIGHVADFTNKAFEALDIVGWEMAESVLPGLARAYAGASRMEESNAWRNPVDLVAVLEKGFEQLDAVMAAGAHLRAGGRAGSPDEEHLIPVLLGDNPDAIVAALLDALRSGAEAAEVAAVVSYAAALRIARFHTSNEFGDWDTALHTFTFANAMEQALRRTDSPALLRGVFDAAMSIYLDRFLNIPAARLPEPNGKLAGLDELTRLLDRQQQVNKAGNAVAASLYAGEPPERLLAMLGHLLLREDRDFHTIQAVEAAFRQFNRRRYETHSAGTGGSEVHFLVAAARYLAAHAPTVRAQEQTYSIAARLHRGERLFEG